MQNINVTEKLLKNNHAKSQRWKKVQTSQSHKHITHKESFSITESDDSLPVGCLLNKLKMFRSYIQ